MIRSPIISVGLFLGLTTAVVLHGQMSHLRLVPAITLPAWTQNIAANASLGRGQAALKDSRLKWDFAGFTGTIPRWHVSLQSQDTRVTGTARLQGDTVVITGVSGTVAFRPRGVAAQIWMIPKQGEITIDLPTGRLVSGWVNGPIEPQSVPDDADVEPVMLIYTLGQGWLEKTS